MVLSLLRYYLIFVILRNADIEQLHTLLSPMQRLESILSTRFLYGLGSLDHSLANHYGRRWSRVLDEFRSKVDVLSLLIIQDQLAMNGP